MTTSQATKDAEVSTFNLTFETSMMPDYRDEKRSRLVEWGRFSRDWEGEEIVDELAEELESGAIDEKAAAMRAMRYRTQFPNCLELHNFCAGRLWSIGSMELASEIWEEAFAKGMALIPAGYKGLIDWSENDNRTFLRIAHGVLLVKMNEKDGKGASSLAKKLLAWSPNDNLGIRLLLGDIDLLNGSLEKALKSFLKAAEHEPSAWYQSALIALRKEDFVSACTYLRKGIMNNAYIAEGLTGRTIFEDHQYWHWTNLVGSEYAVDFLNEMKVEWSIEERSFVDWVFNSAEVLQERAELRKLEDGLSYEREPDKRQALSHARLALDERMNNDVSERMVRKVLSRRGKEIWPWEFTQRGRE